MTLGNRLRDGANPMIGYWVMMDCPPATERLARVGYDFILIDMQHGLLDYRSLLGALPAVEAARGPASIVRVPENNASVIGQVLDAGAMAIMVPLVNTPEEARAVVQAVKYHPVGSRSFGPMRASLHLGIDPRVANEETAIILMIETPQGLDNVEAIAAVPGVDALYYGPADLRLAIGGATIFDPAVETEFQAALERIKAAALVNGIGAGAHTSDGVAAAEKLRDGFTFATVVGDMVHLEVVAARYLADARAALT